MPDSTFWHRQNSNFQNKLPNTTIIEMEIIDPLAGFFERRDSLKPHWVKAIKMISVKKSGQKSVQASFSTCSCKKTQEITGITASRNINEATRDLIAKVGVQSPLKLIFSLPRSHIPHATC
jgi:hypothetical protein